MPQVLSQSDVRLLFGRLSRPNYYQVQFGGLSAGLLAHLGSRGVNSQFIASDMGLLAFNASLPGSSLATVESNNFHGVVENFAHTKIYTPLSISFYTDDQYKSLKFLEHWMEPPDKPSSVPSNSESGETYIPNIPKLPDSS